MSPLIHKTVYFIVTNFVEISKSYTFNNDIVFIVKSLWIFLAPKWVSVVGLSTAANASGAWLSPTPYNPITHNLPLPIIRAGGDFFFQLELLSRQNYASLVKVWYAQCRQIEKHQNQTNNRQILVLSASDPCGNRTHVNGVRGRCLNRLTNGPY